MIQKVDMDSLENWRLFYNYNLHVIRRKRQKQLALYQILSKTIQFLKIISSS